ncbi:surface carbohydrate biosynthesis protein [Alphaproteobacteria bacterium LSUCC0396]
MSRICLIIDNPLRDLDGLCLISWYLAQAGVEVFLVPMYAQGFDVPSLQPDVVLANYARVNNLELLKLYQRQGIRVAILDTEGVGEWWPNHAQLLRQQNVKSFVDQYYCWGREQAKELLEARSFAPGQVTVTGCPRYDFIANQWRPALPANDVKPGYILINTNFPVVNPQFSEDASTEVRGWVDVGWGSQSRAEEFVRASELLFEDVRQNVTAIVKALPEETFVLRPHPFESMSPYEKMAESLPNLLLRKEGTSLQWINQAAALLHVNCFTGVEAGLMHIETLGFEWLNRKEIRDHSSEPFRVSRNASSFEEMVYWLKHLANERNSLPPLPSRDDALRRLVNANYRAVDGHSAKLVADSLIRLAEKGPQAAAVNVPTLAARQRMVHMARRWLGYRGASLIKNLTTPAKLQRARNEKIPSLEAVAEVLERIQSASAIIQRPRIRNTLRSDYVNPFQSSFKSLRISSS